MSSATFTQSRSQALNLENQTESLLSQYSNFQNVKNSTSPDEEELRLNNAIKEILMRREDVISRLNRISETDLNLPASKLQQLQRHKEILNQHKVSLTKIETNLEAERNRNNLLFSVRSDINAHKTRDTAITDAFDSGDANDYILNERVRADNANSFADRLLQQAYRTRDELYSQRHYLNSAQSRMMSTIQSVPGINVLISRINTRRKRDTVILASIISLCIIVLFFI